MTDTTRSFRNRTAQNAGRNAFSHKYFLRLGCAGLSLVLMGCAAVHSVSSGKVTSLRDGVSYSLPVSYYRVSIGGGKADASAIEVAHDIQPDNISFSLDISRNSLVERKQNYGINTKGLLTTAKTEDTGKITDILKEAAKSIVALGDPATGTGAIFKGNFTDIQKSGNNRLSAEEYEAFITELKKLNYKFVCKAGDTVEGKSIPTEGGSFRLDFQAPKSGGKKVGEAEIRESLRKASRRAGADRPDFDEDLLAAGILARPLSAGTMTYTVFVKREVVNNYRDTQAGNQVRSAKSQVDKARSDLAKEETKVGGWATEIKRMETDISNLEKRKETAKEDGKAGEAMLAAILGAPDTAKAQLEGFNGRPLGIVRSDEYWAKYGDAIEVSLSDEPVAGGRKAIISMAILFNTEIQKLTNARTNAVDDELKAIKTSLDDLKAKNESWGDTRKKTQDDVDRLQNDYEASRATYAHATEDIPIVIVSDRMPVVDESHAQLILLRRSLVGATTNDVTLVDGVVSVHAINEPSEVLDTVKIPLTVVEAVLGTVSSLWTKKSSSLAEEKKYLEAEKALIEARAALEAAKTQ